MQMHLELSAQELFDQYDADSDGCLSQLEVLNYSQGLL